MEGRVFRNYPMTATWLTVMLIGLLFAAETDRIRYDIVGLFLGVYAAYAAGINILGTDVKRGFVSFPLPIIPMLPLLVIGRKRVHVGDIVYLQFQNDLFANAALDLQAEKMWRLLFSNERARLAFVEAVHSIRPTVRIYP